MAARVSAKKLRVPGRGLTLRVATALTLGVLFASCASVGPSVTDVKVPGEIQSAQRFQKEYLLAPDDQLEVVVMRAPEVSRNVVIRPDGYLSLPILGDVRASGRTVRELDVELTERFSARLVNPEVSVIATKVRQPVVYVTGEVNNPVAVPLRDAPTAIQAIAVAGGFRKSAAANQVTIVRLAEDGHLRALIASNDNGGQAGPYMSLRAVALRADDLVFVPESGRGQFTRFFDDFINRPLAGFTWVFSTYINFKLLDEFN